MQIRHVTWDGRMLRVANASGLEPTLVFIVANGRPETKATAIRNLANVSFADKQVESLSSRPPKC